MVRAFDRMAATLLALCAGHVWACSLCLNSVTQATLSEELARCSVVAVGTLANPKFTETPGAPIGAGTTEFHLERAIKGKVESVVTIPRYLPVLDAKNPPRFLVFLTERGGKLEVVHGVSLKTPAVSEYLAGAEQARAKGRLAALQYYGQFLDHAEETIAHDAFIEFAKSKDEEVGQVARLLSAPRLRQLLTHCGLESERLSLFAFMLGACGDAKDLDFFRSALRQPTEAAERGMDGILAGYIMLDAAEGWKHAFALLADSKQRFPMRYGALRMLRFFHGWKGAQMKNEILTGLKILVPDGELADLAIEDLRRWKIYELTPLILEQFDRPSHRSPIVRRTIIRYALSCPAPEATRFLERIRPHHAETIDDVRAGLELQ
jgi:hypothetical protein